MMRYLGLAAASGLTAVTATGIAALILYDFVGDDGMRGLWNTATAAMIAPALHTPAANAIFQPQKQFSFFEESPVEGTPYSVSTGGSYGAIADVEANRPARQWCYLSLASGGTAFAERFDLGRQDGEDDPVFTAAADFDAGVLARHGFTPDRLASLARTHCRFGRLDPLG